MRYLVTGGAGFIGSYLVEALVATGHDVVVLDDLSTGKPQNLLTLRDGAQFIRGSVTDSAACCRAMDGVDYVFHLAALASVAHSVDEPVAAHEVNTAGTLNILFAAQQACVRRVVYAGSTAAYGDAVEVPNHEDLPCRPLSPYAATKLAAEDYCMAFSATYGLEMVTLRYFNVFGPRQDPASPYAAVIPLFIRAALRGEPPVIYGDGEQTRDFIYVANVVRANLLACHASVERIVGQVLNVGCGAVTARVRALPPVHGRGWPSGHRSARALAPPRPPALRRPRHAGRGRADALLHLLGNAGADVIKILGS